MDDVVSHIKLLLGFRMEERRGGGNHVAAQHLPPGLVKNGHMRF